MADCLIQFHDPEAGQCIDVRSSSRDTFANEIAHVYNGYLKTVKGNQEDPVYMGEFYRLKFAEPMDVSTSCIFVLSPLRFSEMRALVC